MSTKRKSGSTSSRGKRKKVSSAKAQPRLENVQKKTPSSQKSETAGTRISLEDFFPPTLKNAWKAESVASQAENIIAAREAYIRRGLVLYLGAGVSCSIGLPTWGELIRSLTVTMMTRRVDEALVTLKSLSDEQIALAKLRIQEDVTQGTGADKSILIMARSIKDFFGTNLAYEVSQALYGPLLKTSRGWMTKLRAFLSGRTQLEEDLAQYPVIANSRLFSAIVQLARAQRDVRGVQAIVNFNYDDLIEEWMRENGIRCDTILSGKASVRDASLPCYHVHGVLPFRKCRDLSKTENGTGLREIIGNFVFSEDEYHTEYSDPYRWSNMTMINELGRYSGLFVGLSLQDPNQRRLIDVTHRQYPDMINYAILTRKTPKKEGAGTKQSILRELFEKVETESFANIGVRVIWTDNYDEIPQRIEDICNIDAPSRRRATPASHKISPGEAGS